MEKRCLLSQGLPEEIRDELDATLGPSHPNENYLVPRRPVKHGLLDYLRRATQSGILFAVQLPQ